VGWLHNMRVVKLITLSCLLSSLQMRRPKLEVVKYLPCEPLVALIWYYVPNLYVTHMTLNSTPEGTFFIQRARKKFCNYYIRCTLKSEVLKKEVRSAFSLVRHIATVGRHLILADFSAPKCTSVIFCQSSLIANMYIT
jgi:hypothetical protein